MFEMLIDGFREYNKKISPLLNMTELTLQILKQNDVHTINKKKLISRS